ncbi:hypothetical protein [Enterobacter sp.]|uniref:hypothetical protein n=1 Tax=Enterobacter sp. TaxID=42895 RepID=UPI00296F6430|nr:hypothetical protein [Enterobacter sp.]
MKNDNEKKCVAIALCALYSDWINHKDLIIKSFENIKSAFHDECIFLLAIQGAEDNKIEAIPGFDSVEIFYLNALGISLARNRCIEEAIKLDCKWIIFHDATLFWPRSSAKFIYDHRNDRYPPRIKLKFSDAAATEALDFSFEFKELNPIYNFTVGLILFELDKIKAVRFNENHGPGERTVYKSGEDVLFIFDYFSQKNDFYVNEANSLYVFHPPRSEDYLKHRVYAKGQGRVFRILLKQHFSFRLLRDCAFFFGNAVFRCILLRKNSLTILRDRLAGFFDEV